MTLQEETEATERRRLFDRVDVSKSGQEPPGLCTEGQSKIGEIGTARLGLEPSAQTGDKGPAIKPLFVRNISNTGRVLRGMIALALFIGAGFGSFVSVWAGAGLAVGGGFALFEALRGWCVLRACGIKTRN